MDNDYIIGVHCPLSHQHTSTEAKYVQVREFLPLSCHLFVLVCGPVSALHAVLVDTASAITLLRFRGTSEDDFPRKNTGEIEVDVRVYAQAIERGKAMRSVAAELEATCTRQAVRLSELVDPCIYLQNRTKSDMWILEAKTHHDHS